MIEEAVATDLEMETIILNNRKGGVGKTTLTSAVGTMLAAMGFLVAVIDGDSQVNASKLTSPRPHEGESYPFTLTQVVTQGVPLLEAMVQARRNLWVIPADKFLEEAALRITRLKNPNLISERIQQLGEQLAKPTPYIQRMGWWDKSSIKLTQFKQEATTDEEYREKPPFLDFLLFDSPPNEDALTDSMLKAGRVVIPINMDQFSIDGLRTRVDYVLATPDANGQPLEILAILPNEIAHKAGNPVSMEFLSDVYRNFPDLTRRPIHADEALKDAWAYGMTILEYGQAYAPKSRGMHEVARLALDIVGWPGKLSGLKECKFCTQAFALVDEEVKALGGELDSTDSEEV